ncbi:MAG: hypothetical protein AAGF04_02840 [Chlamydiota bacterium]
MKIGVVGVHCRTTALAFRESLAKSLQSIPAEWASVTLCTCNRVEIYFSGERLWEIRRRLLAHIARLLPSKHVYTYSKKACFLHLALVTSGLDSPLFLESDIQRQVKRAYEQARSSSKLPKVVHYAFQKGLHVAKTLRALVPSESQTSLGLLIWEKSVARFANLAGKKLLLIGFSETNRRIYNYHHRKEWKEIAFSSRSLEAREFCRKKQIRFLPWKSSLYLHFDTIVVATSAKEYILFELPVKKSTLLFDISVPRLIDPAIEKGEIQLINMDHIDRIFSSQKQAKRSKKDVYVKLVEGHVERLVTSYEKEKLIYCSSMA